MSVIQKRLEEARLEAELSQAKLGVLAGINEDSASGRMNQYERGKRSPDLLTLQRIGKVLNLPVAYFYSESDDMAILVKEFHRMKSADKKRLLKFIKSIE